MMVMLLTWSLVSQVGFISTTIQCRALGSEGSVNPVARLVHCEPVISRFRLRLHLRRFALRREGQSSTPKTVSLTSSAMSLTEDASHFAPSAYSSLPTAIGKAAVSRSTDCPYQPYVLLSTQLFVISTIASRRVRDPGMVPQSWYTSM